MMGQASQLVYGTDDIKLLQAAKISDAIWWSTQVLPALSNKSFAFY